MRRYIMNSIHNLQEITTNKNNLFSCASPSTSFNWETYVEIPKASPEWYNGSQVLNFFPYSKDHSQDEEVKSFIETHFKEALAINTDAGLLRFASDKASQDGFFLEMGVCTGRTINFIAALNPEKTIYGFDSFEGLPEEWKREDINIPAGTFRLKDSGLLPPVLHNVSLIRGMFQNTLSLFKSQILKNNKISFIHIDCDIYSSTKAVFDNLGDNLYEGSIIVFDEYYNYPGFKEHEFKAFQEFLISNSKKAKCIAFNLNFEQAAFEIVSA
jgi:hypothetical protein